MTVILSTSPPALGAFITAKQLAAELSVSASTIRSWRPKGLGPPWKRIGHSVRYRRADVEAWIAAQQSGGEDVT